MKKAAVLLFALATLASVFADEKTNVTSAVEVKGWKRHYVYGTADGNLIDPSGKIASYAAGAAEGETTQMLSELADESQSVATNNLARMYAVTNLLETFTKQIYVQAHLYPDLTQLSNCWGRVVREWTDGSRDHCWVYFSRTINVPPTMKRRYSSETGTNWVEGVWTDFADTRLVDGYENCREIVYERPADFAMRNTFSQPYLNFGMPDTGFDFGTRAMTLDGELPLTCAVTNSLGKVWWWVNGVKVRGETDAN